MLEQKTLECPVLRLLASVLMRSLLYGDGISGSNVGSLIHLPLSSTLLAPGQEITSLSLKESVDIYILGLPVNASQASS
jgi:hypothetical protein